jgi:DNA-binding CsgD family transcriptional regulator
LTACSGCWPPARRGQPLLRRLHRARPGRRPPGRLRAAGDHGRQPRAAGPPGPLPGAARPRARRHRHFEEALALLDGQGRPFDLARIALAYEEALRRARRRADARTHLRGALETFQRLGTTPWAERAAAELRATGETARRRDPSTLSQLTPQELQIVQLVGEGGTNREIGAQLFLSRRTIDYHLRNVFVKLGVSSRAELIRLALADR